MKEDIKQLVELLTTKKGNVKEDKNVLATTLSSLQSILERYYDKDSSTIKQVTILSQYVSILLRAKKDSYPVSPRCNVKNVAEDTNALIDSVIEEVKAIGLPNSKSTIVSKDINITNTLNQNQSQTQNLNVLVDLLKESLAPYQLEELKEVMNSDADKPTKRKNIIDKIASFGTNVGASILANILTNPLVQSLFV